MLDGLLYHESDLRIEEHYTDTAGFTDHLFALMSTLGFRFAPRIRDLADTKLYGPKRARGEPSFDALKPLIGGTINVNQIRTHWDDILRLAASIKQRDAVAWMQFDTAAGQDGGVVRHVGAESHVATVGLDPDMARLQDDVTEDAHREDRG